MCIRDSAGTVRIKVVVVLFDGDKPKPDLREDPFQIGSCLNIVTPEPAEITNYKALDPAGADVVHQTVELRSIKNRTRSSVVHIGIYQIQVGTLCNEMCIRDRDYSYTKCEFLPQLHIVQSLRSM